MRRMPPTDCRPRSCGLLVALDIDHLAIRAGASLIGQVVGKRGGDIAGAALQANRREHASLRVHSDKVFRNRDFLAAGPLELYVFQVGSENGRPLDELPLCSCYAFRTSKIAHDIADSCLVRFAAKVRLSRSSSDLSLIFAKRSRI